MHETDRFDNNALMEAIKGNHRETAKLLIKAGSQIRLPTAQLAPLLCNYAAEGQVEQISLYHLGGADVFVGDYDQRTAIHIAASHGQQSVLRLLIDIAMESEDTLSRINILDVFSNPPLTDALRHRHKECVAMLVNAGALIEGSKNVLQEMAQAAGQDDK